VDTKECDTTDTELLNALHPGKCIRTLGYWLVPELHQSLAFQKHLEGTAESGAQTFYLFSGWTQKKVREELRKWENSAWVNPQTKKVELLFTTYNPHEDLMTATFIVMFLNNGGHFHKLIEPVSIWIHPYHNWLCWVFDCAWLSIVMKIFVEEIMDLCTHICRHGPMTGFARYIGPANFVDWLSVISAMVLVAFWIQHQFMLETMRQLMREADYKIPGSWSDDDKRTEYFDIVQLIVQRTIIFRTLLAVYPFVIVSRFFKAFSSQPRLAVVTRTITVASVDIIHFLVVFLLVLTVYASSAMILFGQEDAYFANFMRSFFSVFRILNGDFDWSQLHQVGRPQAYLWFLSFVILLNWIMLNMLLAIIMDVYTSVKGEIGPGAETLWSQSYEIYSRKKAVLSGEKVSLSAILTIIDPEEIAGEADDEEDNEPPFTIETFMAAVKGLREEQAIEILTEAERYRLSQQEQTDTTAEAMKRMRSIQTTLETMHYYQELLIQNGGFFNNAPAHGAVRAGPVAV
jgi:hypothetical protein